MSGCFLDIKLVACDHVLFNSTLLLALTLDPRHILFDYWTFGRYVLSGPLIKFFIDLIVFSYLHTV